MKATSVRAIPARWFSTHKTVKRGAFPVWTFTVPESSHRPAGTAEFLLLTDGRLMPGPIHTLAQYAATVRDAEGVGRRPLTPACEIEAELQA